MHNIRDFQLVQCANVSGPAEEDPVRVLEEAVAEEKAEYGFGDSSSEPSVMYKFAEVPF